MLNLLIIFKWILWSNKCQKMVKHVHHNSLETWGAVFKFLVSSKQQSESWTFEKLEPENIFWFICILCWYVYCKFPCWVLYILKAHLRICIAHKFRPWMLWYVALVYAIHSRYFFSIKWNKLMNKKRIFKNYFIHSLNSCWLIWTNCFSFRSISPN